MFASRDAVYAFALARSLRMQLKPAQVESQTPRGGFSNKYVITTLWITLDSLQIASPTSLDSVISLVQSDGFILLNQQVKRLPQTNSFTLRYQ